MIFRARLRAKGLGPNSSGALWFRADRQAGGYSFFENMGDRPILDSLPNAYRIAAPVGQDTKEIALGFLLNGTGSIWVDSIRFDVYDPAIVSSDPGGNSGAVAYLDSALTLIHTTALNPAGAPWITLRGLALLMAQGARRPEDTYPAIRSVLHALGDRHSMLLSPRPGPLGADPVPDSIHAATARLLSGRIGFVQIDAIAAGDQAQRVRFATSLQASIKKVARQHVCGWIVDLRSNSGGDMWPMLAGIGPILGDGIAGMFVDDSGRRTTWGYSHGASWLGKTVQVRAVTGGNSAPTGRLPVAVLQGPATASSGEAMVLAFSGRAGSRSFGQPSAGLSTANTSFPLIDGATLVVTSGTMADRNGVTYGGVVNPDETVEPLAESDSRGAEPGDPVLAKAVSWIESIGRCSN
ncbi:MAG: S41 family peptidase [Gemmatimonadota bacterium]